MNHEESFFPDRKRLFAGLTADFEGDNRVRRFGLFLACHVRFLSDWLL